MFRDIKWQNGDWVVGNAGLELATGSAVIVQDLAARVQCPRGAHWAHPYEGTDITQFVQQTHDDLTLLEMRQELEMECIRDARVQKVTATITPNSLKTVNAVVQVGLTDGAKAELEVIFSG